MDGVNGLLITILSSNGIPNGCYSASVSHSCFVLILQISYMHNVINLGHMKKNRDPQLGCFFSIDSTNQLSLQLYSIDFTIHRREHTITPESVYWNEVIHRKPFALASISSADIISNRYGKSTQLNLQITDHVFDSVVCSLQVQIQRVYKDTKFSVPKSISISPCLLLLTIKRAEITIEDWNSQYRCRLVLPNKDCCLTDPVLGITPSWNQLLYINNTKSIQNLRFSIELYRKGDVFDMYLGSGSYHLKWSSFTEAEGVSYVDDEGWFQSTYIKMIGGLHWFIYFFNMCSLAQCVRGLKQ